MTFFEKKYDKYIIYTYVFMLNLYYSDNNRKILFINDDDYDKGKYAFGTLSF